MARGIPRSTSASLHCAPLPPALRGPESLSTSRVASTYCAFGLLLAGLLHVDPAFARSLEGRPPDSLVPAFITGFLPSGFVLLSKARLDSRAVRWPRRPALLLVGAFLLMLALLASLPALLGTRS